MVKMSRKMNEMETNQTSFLSQHFTPDTKALIYDAYWTKTLLCYLIIFKLLTQQVNIFSQK